MPGLVDVAWFVYSNSGPALDLAFIGLVVLGYKFEIQPRLTDLEDVQDDHADDLQNKALNASERDVMLENAHERVDDAEDLAQQAEEARASLRARINRLERREAWRSGGGEDDGGGPPPIGPDGQRDAHQSVSPDGGQPPPGGDPGRNAMTDGGATASQEAHGSDDDHLDLTLNIDVEGDGYVHVETTPTGTSWMPDICSGGGSDG
jgi:hypothetical protein